MPLWLSFSMPTHAVLIGHIAKQNLCANCLHYTTAHWHIAWSIWILYDSLLLWFYHNMSGIGEVPVTSKWSQSKVPGKHLAPAEWSAGLVPLHPRRSPPRREFINAMQLWNTTRRWCLPLPHLSWTLLSITPFYTLLYLYTLLLYPFFILLFWGEVSPFTPFIKGKRLINGNWNTSHPSPPLQPGGGKDTPALIWGIALPMLSSLRWVRCWREHQGNPLKVIKHSGGIGEFHVIW